MRQLVFVFFLLIYSSASTQNDLERVKLFCLENKLAIRGYDPVAYFASSKAKKGTSKISTNYQGINYHFSSEANKNAFNKNPEKYEPQYGGWCAFAMGDDGKKVEINPENFKIVDGKLYLFYNAYFNNTLKNWNTDEKKLMANADQNWSKIINNK